MKAEIIEKYKCGECGEKYDDSYAAERCCPPEVEEVYICSVCGHEEWQYEKAELHLKQPHGSNALTPTEDYLERLRSGERVLGEWAVQMEYETDFLIPVR